MPGALPGRRTARSWPSLSSPAPLPAARAFSSGRCTSLTRASWWATWRRWTSRWGQEGAGGGRRGMCGGVGVRLGGVWRRWTSRWGCGQPGRPWRCGWACVDGGEGAVMTVCRVVCGGGGCMGLLVGGAPGSEALHATLLELMSVPCACECCGLTSTSAAAARCCRGSSRRVARLWHLLRRRWPAP